MAPPTLCIVLVFFRPASSRSSAPGSRGLRSTAVGAGRDVTNRFRPLFCSTPRDGPQSGSARHPGGDSEATEPTLLWRLASACLRVALLCTMLAIYLFAATQSLSRKQAAI